MKAYDTRLSLCPPPAKDEGEIPLLYAAFAVEMDRVADEVRLLDEDKIQDGSDTHLFLEMSAWISGLSGFITGGKSPTEVCTACAAIGSIVAEIARRHGDLLPLQEGEDAGERKA